MVLAADEAGVFGDGGGGGVGGDGGGGGGWFRFVLHAAKGVQAAVRQDLWVSKPHRERPWRNCCEDRTLWEYLMSMNGQLYIHSRCLRERRRQRFMTNERHSVDL